MESGEYILVMANFISGNIDLSGFKDFVEERLFELRRKPEENDEKNDLSSIELFLHEIEEGLRDKNEIYNKVQFILDNILLNKLSSKPLYFSPTPPNLPYLLSRTCVDERISKTKELTAANR